MNTTQGLRLAMQLLRDAKCPTCGKRIAVMATSWKGHGTGQHGTSHYDATSFEARTAETHCTCAHEAPKPPTLREAAEAQRRQYEREGHVTMTGFETEVR